MPQLTVMEAAAQSGLSHHTLRVQIKRGRLRALKRGRDWFIQRRDLAHYMKHIHDPVQLEAARHRRLPHQAARQHQRRTNSSAA